MRTLVSLDHRPTTLDRSRAEAPVTRPGAEAPVTRPRAEAPVTPPRSAALCLDLAPKRRAPRTSLLGTKDRGPVPDRAGPLAVARRRRPTLAERCRAGT